MPELEIQLESVTLIIILLGLLQHPYNRLLTLLTLYITVIKRWSVQWGPMGVEWGGGGGPNAIIVIHINWSEALGAMVGWLVGGGL